MQKLTCDMVDNTRFNRRTVLKSAGSASAIFSLGVSPAGGSHAANHRVKLPKLRNGKEVIKKHSVPKKWDAHRRNAKQILNNNSFLDMDGVIRSGLSRSPKDYDGKNGLQITLGVDSDSDAKTKVPNAIEKIPIGIEEINSKDKSFLAKCNPLFDDFQCHDCWQGEFLEGGYPIKTGADGNTGTAGFLANTAFNDVMITVAHLWVNVRSKDPNCSKYIYGDTVEFCSGKEIGPVIDWDIEDDWAMIDINDGVKGQGDIDMAGPEIHVDGVVDESCMHSWVAMWPWNQPCLRSMGRNSSVTAGRIKHVNFAYTNSNEDLFLDCISYESDGSQDGVYTYCDIVGGDSGGPTWHKEDGKAYITNLNSSGHIPNDPLVQTCSGNLRGQDSSGIAAYEIFNDTSCYLPFGNL